MFNKTRFNGEIGSHIPESSFFLLVDANPHISASPC